MDDITVLLTLCKLIFYIYLQGVIVALLCIFVINTYQSKDYGIIDLSDIFDEYRFAFTSWVGILMTCLTGVCMVIGKIYNTLHSIIYKPFRALIYKLERVVIYRRKAKDK